MGWKGNGSVGEVSRNERGGSGTGKRRRMGQGTVRE